MNILDFFCNIIGTFFAVMREVIRNDRMEEGKEDLLRLKRKDRLPYQLAGELVLMNSQPCRSRRQPHRGVREDRGDRSLV